MLIVLLCVGQIKAPSLDAIQPPPGFAEKSITELLSMLDRTDPNIREDATAAIAWRLGREIFTTTNVEPALVRSILSKTSLLLQHDDNQRVRLAAVSVALQLNAWTNTAPTLVEASADTNRLVRVRAITALLDVNEKRHEQVPSSVLSRLEECFGPDASIEVLWQASFAAGKTGSPRFIPVLETLATNSNTKVRSYASEAVRKLESVPRKRVEP